MQSLFCDHDFFPPNLVTFNHRNVLKKRKHKYLLHRMRSDADCPRMNSLGSWRKGSTLSFIPLKTVVRSLKNVISSIDANKSLGAHRMTQSIARLGSDDIWHKSKSNLRRVRFPVLVEESPVDEVRKWIVLFVFSRQTQKWPLILSSVTWKILETNNRRRIIDTKLKNWNFGCLNIFLLSVRDTDYKTLL